MTRNLVVEINPIVDAIISKQASAPGNGSLLVALSGIDGSGKSTLARQCVGELDRSGLA